MQDYTWIRPLMPSQFHRQLEFRTNSNGFFDYVMQPIRRPEVPNTLVYIQTEPIIQEIDRQVIDEIVQQTENTREEQQMEAKDIWLAQRTSPASHQEDFLVVAPDGIRPLTVINSKKYEVGEKMTSLEDHVRANFKSKTAVFPWGNGGYVISGTPPTFVYMSPEFKLPAYWLQAKQDGTGVQFAVPQFFTQPQDVDEGGLDFAWEQAEPDVIQTLLDAGLKPDASEPAVNVTLSFDLRRVGVHRAVFLFRGSAVWHYWLILAEDGPRLVRPKLPNLFGDCKVCTGSVPDRPARNGGPFEQYAAGMNALVSNPWGKDLRPSPEAMLWWICNNDSLFFRPPILVKEHLLHYPAEGNPLLGMPGVCLPEGVNADQFNEIVEMETEGL